MDELKVYIDLKPLTDEEIKASHFTLKDLWMVQVRGRDPYGPYDTNTLKDYAHKYQFLFEDAKVYNLDDDKWYEMFKVSQFQRRKPQLVSAQNLIQNQDFYILNSGQKDGPYHQDQIQKLLDKGHVLPSTQISLDEGKSWIKLYEYHAFDRRTKKSNQELPFKPNENILDKVNLKKEEILKSKETQDALVELAFIGETTTKIQLEKHITKEKTQTKHNHPQILKKSKRLDSELENESSSSAWKIAAVCFGLLVFVGVFFNTKKDDNKEIKPIAEVQTDTRSIDNSEREITKRAPANDESFEKRQENSLNKMRKFKKVRAERKTPVVNGSNRTRAKNVNTAAKKPSRFVKKKKVSDTFEQEIEKIDINDPEIQDELTRQLAGEYEDEGREEEYYQDEPQQNNVVEEEPYTDDASDQEAPPAEDYAPYEDEQPVEHENY